MLNNIPQQTLYGLMDLIYPIGSYYITESSELSTEAAMNTKFGGTWKQVTGRFLYGSTSAGSEAGESSHILTIDEMPNHDHTINHDHAVFTTTSGGGHTHSFATDNFDDSATGMTAALDNAQGNNFTNNSAGEHTHEIDVPLFEGSSGTRGGGVAHNNMPPYRTVYMYRRTALSGGGLNLIAFISLLSKRSNEC